MKSVAISTATANASAVVAAKTGFKICVHSYTINAGGTVAVKFQSGTTDITGAMAMVANQTIGNSISPTNLEPDACLFETAAGEALNIHLGGAVQVSGHLSYSYCI